MLQKAVLALLDPEDRRACCALSFCVKRPRDDQSPEPLPSPRPLVGSQQAMRRALRRLLQARQELCEGLQAALKQLDMQWYAAAGSKAVAAGTMVTGLALLFIPFTTVSGAITLISGAGVAAATLGGESVAEQASESEVQRKVAADQAAERALEGELRSVLGRAGAAGASGFDSALRAWAVEVGLACPEGPLPASAALPEACLLRPLAGVGLAGRGAVLGLTRAAVQRLGGRLRDSLAALRALEERLEREEPFLPSPVDEGPMALPVAVRGGAPGTSRGSAASSSFGAETAADEEDGAALLRLPCAEGAGAPEEGLSAALQELLERRQMLADWLDGYLERFDVIMGSMVGSKTLATVTTITGALLFFIPPTSLAGAIALASGTGIGAGAWGSEAVAEQVAKERVQALVDADDVAHEAFGRALRTVLQGQRAPDGEAFDARDAGHARAARAVEDWVRLWLLESATPLEGSEAVEVSSLVPRMLSLRTKLATRRLRDAVLSSLADFRRLEAMLAGHSSSARDAEADLVGRRSGRELAVGVLPALEASLDTLIQKRTELLAKLEGLIRTCKLKRGVANSSKTIAAVATVTGAVLFFIPATSLAGLITIVSASGVGAATTGGEATANRATMRALQQCADEDRAAEADFDGCLRAALRGAGPGPLPSRVATLLGSWLGGRLEAAAEPPSLQSEAVRSLRMIWTPLDCAYSWATASYTAHSVQQVYEDVRAAQERLLALRQCLFEVGVALGADAGALTPNARSDADGADFSPGGSGLSALQGLREGDCSPRALTPSAGNAAVVAFLDGLIEERALVLGEEEGQTPQTLLEALVDLIAKRKQLIDWMDQFLEGQKASQLAIGGSQLLSVVGNITGVALLFIPATSVAGGIVLTSMYGVDVGVGTNKTLQDRSKESNLQRCVAEDQRAQQAFDRRLLAVLRREEWPSGEATEAPDGDLQQNALAIVESWVQARSALAHGRGPRGGLGAGSGAALPLQAKETARQFREDLRRLLADLRELRLRLEIGGGFSNSS